MGNNEQKSLKPDDPEMQDWRESISSVIAYEGTERADDILEEVVERARASGAAIPFASSTAYINTIPVKDEPKIPGDREMEHRIAAAIRWNAAAMVLRANKDSTEIGGHIASYQSAATLYETGFNHFWHAPSEEHGGDLILIQGHSSPGL
jgi:pyruvate dehydrogenase E1 component